MKRRRFLKRSLAGTVAVGMPILPTFSKVVEETRFGVADASYMMRRYRKLKSEAYPPFADALEMIEHCSSLGFGGMQVGVGGWDSDFSKKVRKRKEELDIFLEAQIRLPKDEEDLDRFDHEVSTAKETGIDVFRTACLSGRRYERFDSMQAFQAFKKAAINSIRLAEPVMKKFKVKLAVENHKDWRINEMKTILNIIDSEWVGVTLDTGNNIALLEDPMEVVEALAPYAFSVHLKDMAVEEYEDGFLLSEVNLGTGSLDIDTMIKTLKKHRPNIRFNLEMITRDPLKIPCLTDKYWATFDQISAPELARYLRRIRTMKTGERLPMVSNRPTDEQLSLEVENNRTCLIYAKQNLGFI